MSPFPMPSMSEMPKKYHLKETFLFLKQWSKDPRSMGSLIPSSKELSRRMAQHLLLKEGHFVVELGGGTGALTRSLLHRIGPENFCVIEKDIKLVQHLRELFPQVLIIHGDATDMSTLIPLSFRKKVSTVISGLPLLTLPLNIQQTIIHESLKMLIPQGRILQFTYSPFSSLPAHKYGLSKSRKGVVFSNFPPASIWSYERIFPHNTDLPPRSTTPQVLREIGLA